MSVQYTPKLSIRSSWESGIKGANCGTDLSKLYGEEDSGRLINWKFNFGYKTSFNDLLIVSINSDFKFIIKFRIKMNLIKKSILRCSCPLRAFHSSNVRFIDPNKVSEVKIPVPWGHVAGKWWGNKESQPTLAIHGGLDNANSFDELIPLLKTSDVLCIDLPGHGFSSHLPQGINLNYLESLVFLRFLVKHHFKWEKVSLLGHSLGSSLCFAYAGIYPSEVKWMINLECSRFSLIPNLSRLVKDYKNCYGICDIALRKSKKGYTWEEIVKHTYTGRQLYGIPLTIKACETLAKRSVYKERDKYFFTLDDRFKYPVLGLLTDRTLFSLAKRVSCNSLNILANNGLLNLPNLPEQVSLINPQLLKLHIDEMKKKSNVTNLTVTGSHHVHLEEPKNISDIINDFIKIH